MGISVEIDGKTKLLGVIGNPIEHTLSPVIHNTLCKCLGINAVYVPIHVENDLMKAINGAFAMGFYGLNITVPYKEEVIKCVADIDETAMKIGAVNTLVPTAIGYKGFNTDMTGIRRALKRRGIDPKGKKAIIIGAGGAAKAVAAMFVKSNAEHIYILNRSLEKAEDIAVFSKKITAVALNEYKSIPKDDYIIVQCTSVGLKADDKLVIDDDEFYSMAIFGYDLIYNPAETPFTRKLNRLSIPCENGLRMLLYQGIEAFEMWFGIEISDQISDIVYKELCKSLYGNNIVLTGYMGSGKTSVGRFISEKNGMSFLDMDEYIENKEGRSINDIFRNDGEKYFRDLETEVLRELSDKLYNTVIATGGGVVLKKENIEILKSVGTVFYLETDCDTICKRLKNDDTRPLLKREDDSELHGKVESMLSQREAYYKLSADHVIKTDGCSLEDISGKIKGVAM